MKNAADGINQMNAEDLRNEQPVLVVENLCRDYKMGNTVVPVLNNVSLRICAGETVAIVGASGAGKSTLLHVIGGLDQPTKGAVRFRGMDLYSISARQRTVLRARSIGFVFQFYHLLPELDVLENVMLPALNSNLGVLGFMRSPVFWEKTPARNNPRARAAKLLQAVGLAERAGHLPAELSGGEQQRSAVARALINDPELLLADEPTGNLDSVTGAHVLNILFELVKDRNRTLLIVTHNSDVARRCDRTLRLQDGALIAV